MVNMEQQNKLHWQKSLLLTMLLTLLIVGGTFLAAKWIRYVEEQAAFVRLYEETNGLAQTFESHMKSDRELLEILSVIIAEYPDPADPELWELLDSYPSVGFLSRLELLLPDDTVLTRGGQTVDSGGYLSFKEEAAQGAHITDRVLDVTGSEGQVVRHYVPVVRDGKTVAMLYGVIQLGTLPMEIEANPYGNQAAIYIIVGATGDFLMDTWHTELGNIWALGDRPMAPGYDNEQLQQGLIDGDTGYVVFVSSTIGEYLYFYYEPISINNWRVALSVPENAVFADANKIQKILNLFFVLEALCFVLYFLWMIHYVRRETGEKQRQLEVIRYISDIEKLLFNAHEKRENIGPALEKIAHILSAGRTGFWMPAQGSEEIFYVWDESKNKLIREAFPGQKNSSQWLMTYFQQGHPQFEAYRPEQLQSILPKDAARIVNNMIAVPVKDLNGHVCAILAACNMPAGSRVDPALLSSASFSFGMFCHNIRLYHSMKERGELDILTGLLNRNRYEQDRETLPKLFHTSLACVYIDANGLHELNNTLGHEAGDRMLKTVAEHLRGTFGSPYTYRIGGDEFLIFAVDQEKDTVERMGRKLESALAGEHIYVSLGIQWAAQIDSMAHLVKAAEQKMYAAKRAYYENEKNDRRRRD